MARTQALCNESHRENTWLSKIRAGPDQIPKRQQRRRKRGDCIRGGTRVRWAVNCSMNRGVSLFLLLDSCFFFLWTHHHHRSPVPAVESALLNGHAQPVTLALGTSLPERLTVGACHRDLNKTNSQCADPTGGTWIGCVSAHPLMSCVCVWGREEDEWWEMMHGMLHGEVRVSASPRVRVSVCLCVCDMLATTSPVNTISTTSFQRRSTGRKKAEDRHG